MARPRSEDKRNAILSAATQVIAAEGASDELLNELYVQLKSELR